MRYALGNSNSNYLLLLNNDTIVDPEFLTEMVKVAESEPAIGIAGAKVYYYDNPNRLQSVWGEISLWTGQPLFMPRALAERIKRIEIDRGQYDSVKEVAWVPGACFLIKKGVLEDIGSLDEGYFSYCEDTDYCLRAKRAGYKIVYVPKAKVWHKGGQSSNKITGFSRYYGARNQVRFIRKHATKWQYRRFLIYFFGFYLWLATGYYLIFHRSPTLLLALYRGVRDGLFNSQAGANFYGCTR
jgi:hypothetical protein